MSNCERERLDIVGHRESSSRSLLFSRDVCRPVERARVRVGPVQNVTDLALLYSILELLEVQPRLHGGELLICSSLPTPAYAGKRHLGENSKARARLEAWRQLAASFVSVFRPLGSVP